MSNISKYDKVSHKDFDFSTFFWKWLSFYSLAAGVTILKADLISVYDAIASLG